MIGYFSILQRLEQNLQERKMHKENLQLITLLPNNKSKYFELWNFKIFLGTFHLHFQMYFTND